MTNESTNEQPKPSTVKRLFSVSGNQCAFPKCEIKLVQGEKVVGKICHIKARSDGGPRHDPDQTNDERRGFDNLVLMCPMHHDVIDSDEDSYTVERLTEIKRRHEEQSTHINEETVSMDVVNQLYVNMNVEAKIQIQNEYQNNGQLAEIIVNYMVPDVPVKSIKVKCRILLNNIDSNLEDIKGRYQYRRGINMRQVTIPQNTFDLCEEVADYLDVKDTGNLFTFYENLMSFNDFLKHVEDHFIRRGLPMDIPLSDVQVNSLARNYEGRLEELLNIDISSLIDRLTVLSE
ncbi:HNH endonuclease [Bacillus sp. NRRL B-14911]|uniref:HNH endonuclease n=1 Tax=Bacillus sp. NRRL B-14911 TaxID=313627 RepID=UPI000681637E|nr:HNH endonuclease [Bacillus sp. NRRL B-14911]